MASTRTRTRSRLRSAAAGLLAIGAAGSAHALAGVCPDGSIFIVKTAAQIPCEGAKEVEPSKMPPLRPENLPRPYLWEVYRERADVGRNPYHLLERAEDVRRGGPETASTPPAVSAPPPESAPAPSASDRVRQLGLSEGEVRDLFVLVELSQQRSPVHFVDSEGGRERLRVSFAHSRAFRDRAEQGGLVDRGTAREVLLFSSVAAQATEFHPHFTLVQGQQAFQPHAGNRAEIGLLRGAVGPQARDAVALGYIVLPEGFDLSRPIDVYWNDRRIESARLML